MSRSKDHVQQAAAERRDRSPKARGRRAASAGGRIPAVVYGRGEAPTAVSIARPDLRRASRPTPVSTRSSPSTSTAPSSSRSSGISNAIRYAAT
ncbi:MAG: hypothetical protein R2695_11565 [Acidimicrobiales bacterium]